MLATWPALFAHHVRRTPDAVAVVFERTSLTYAELDARADRLARVLVAQGAGPEQVVGLALPRSIALIVAEVAVLKSGAAYLPMDPTTRPSGSRYMLGDARPTCLVTTAELADRLPDGPWLPGPADEDRTSAGRRPPSDGERCRRRVGQRGVRDLHVRVDRSARRAWCCRTRRGEAGRHRQRAVRDRPGQPGAAVRLAELRRRVLRPVPGAAHPAAGSSMVPADRRVPGRS